METKRSVVWRYFTDLKNIHGNRFVECTLCNKRYSHKGNTTNMFHHMKAKHPDTYDGLLRQRQMIYETSPSTDKYELPNVASSLRVEVKTEGVFMDASQSYQSESDVQSDCMMTSQLQEQDCHLDYLSKNTFNNDGNSYVVGEQDDNIPEPSTSYLNISNMQPNRSINSSKLDADILSKISAMASDMHHLREIVTCNGDSHFFSSVSSEMENMDEDSRDLIKAAIWQIIYKVKCAKKKNTELNLNSIFKDNV